MRPLYKRLAYCSSLAVSAALALGCSSSDSGNQEEAAGAAGQAPNAAGTNSSGAAGAGASNVAGVMNTSGAAGGQSAGASGMTGAAGATGGGAGATGGAGAGAGGTAGAAGAAGTAGVAGMTGDGGVAGDDGGGDDDVPVEGRYVPCSGEAPPAMQLTPIFDLDNRDPLHAVVPPLQPDAMYIAMRSGALVRGSLANPEAAVVELMTINVDDSGECGFLSLALHPNFDGTTETRGWASHNPSCAAIFGATTPGQSVISEFTISGDTATLGQPLLELSQPEGNHNGGQIAFGPDGYLYIGFGDGGGSNDQHGQNGNAQDPSALLGKILRIDVDNPDVPPTGNLTSADVGGAAVDERILHWGVRNPWRFSFDALNGDLFIGDVGQNNWEEIDRAPAGSAPLNFGWSDREGFVDCSACNHNLFAGATETPPIYAYDRNGGAGVAGSVTGGFVYRGSALPGMYGRYIFGDFVRGTMTAITWDESSAGEGEFCDEEVLQPTVLINGAPSSIGQNSLASFAEDADGELYAIGLANGVIWRFDPAE